MHIGVDATCWTNRRGYGRHARALLRALLELDTENEYTFFLDSPAEGAGVPERARVRLVQSASPTTQAASAAGRRSLRDMWRLGRAMADPALDVLLFPTIYSYVPVFSRSKKVVMIHDVIAEKFPQMTLPRLTARLAWAAKVAVGRRQAAALVTVSEHSGDGIAAYFGIPRQEIHVVGEASDPVFRVLEDPRPEPIFHKLGVSPVGRKVVYVGGFSPHKNLEMLVELFAEIAAQDDFRDIQLLLVGDYQRDAFHSCFRSIQRKIAALGLADRIMCCGFVPDEELVVLLNVSSVLVLPSFLEGFGLPAVEAAACGLPVIATTQSPLPKLLGAGGLFLDPRDRAGWKDALQDVLADAELRRKMSAAGAQAARQLTWEHAARQMLNVFHKICA